MTRSRRAALFTSVIAGGFTLLALPAVAQKTPPAGMPVALSGHDGKPVVAHPAAVPAPTALYIPPPVTAASYIPFANLPPVNLDEANNSWGIAQQTARERGLQGRVLWIDATANLDTINSKEKIITLVRRIKSTGFNTIVLEIKPIIGYTLYPSKFAPKLNEWVRPWGTKTMPAHFDPLAVFISETKAQNIPLIVNMNVFSEGHRDFGKGAGYDHPEWQTILYEEQTFLRGATGTQPMPLVVHSDDTLPADDTIALYTDRAKLAGDLPQHHPGPLLLVLVDSGGRVTAQIAGESIAPGSEMIPVGGAALAAFSPVAEDFLRRVASVGQTLTLESSPAFVPIGQRPQRQVPLMTNPFNPVVSQRMLDMLAEVVTKYAVSGIMFDDRLRFAGLDADFSPTTRQQFEEYMGGKSLHWPEDVLRFRYDFPTMTRHTIPGTYYEAWLTFRALKIRNWLAEARATIKRIRPAATVSTYVGSWYPDYPDVGANWAADDFTAGYRFLNSSYQKTGWAGLVDFVTTGCYYNTATIADAAAHGQPVGESVEAAGQFSNRAVNDQTWVYAGLSLSDFDGKPDELRKVLQAAAASTQGIMVFDLSHNIEPMWPVFAEAFRSPAVAPHTVPGLLDEVRRKHAARKASGAIDPPVILYRGASGTGF